MINRMIRESSRSVIRALATHVNTCALLHDTQCTTRPEGGKILYVHLGDRIKEMGRRWHGGKFGPIHEAIQKRARRECISRGMRL